MKLKKISFQDAVSFLGSRTGESSVSENTPHKKGSGTGHVENKRFAGSYEKNRGLTEETFKLFGDYLAPPITLVMEASASWD